MSLKLVYITGPPGVGKTTIQRRLTDLGYTAYDVDDPLMGGPVNKATGRVVAMPPNAGRTKEWFDQHEWRLFSGSVIKLRLKSGIKDDLIFVCGVAANDKDILYLFDTVIYLEAAQEIIKARVLSRSDNDYGKSDHEINLILEKYAELKERYSVGPGIRVDAEEDIDKVVKTIINLVMQP